MQSISAENMETLRALSGDISVGGVKGQVNKTAVCTTVTIILLIIVVVIIVIVVSKTQHFVSFETPNGQLSEGCIVNKDGEVVHQIRYGDYSADKPVTISGIPDSGEQLKSDISVPYPDLLQTKKEKYTNMNGYQVSDHNTQRFIDPTSIIQSSITENAEMSGLQNSTNNIRMIQEKNIDNTLQTQELDTMKQLQINVPMSMYDVQATEEANRYQQGLENTQNFINQTYVGKMQIAPNQNIGIYERLGQATYPSVTINSGRPTGQAYINPPAIITPKVEIEGAKTKAVIENTPTVMNAEKIVGPEKSIAQLNTGDVVVQEAQQTSQVITPKAETYMIIQRNKPTTQNIIPFSKLLTIFWIIRMSDQQIEPLDTLISQPGIGKYVTDYLNKFKGRELKAKRDLLNRVIDQYNSQSKDMLMEDMRAWYESKGLTLPIEYVKTEVVEVNK